MKTEPYYTEDYRGYRIKIYQDQYADSPREWNNVGAMACWHRRYTLGDQQPKVEPDEWLRELLELDDNSPIWKIVDLIELAQEKFILLPLWLYDHSGISMSTSCTYPYNDRWDAGQVGWIYISKKDAIKEWGNKKFTKEIREKAIAHLVLEVKTYNDYLVGNVFAFELLEIDDDDEDGDILESVGGYYPEPNDLHGYEYCLKDARHFIDSEIKYVEEKKYEDIQELERNGVLEYA
jgi:hypothetical protein